MDRCRCRRGCSGKRVLTTTTTLLASLSIYHLACVLILDVCQPLGVSSYALKDAIIEAGKPLPTQDLGDNWIIVRKSMTWGDASADCNLEHYRLVNLPTLEVAKKLVDAIKAKSVAYTDGYDNQTKQHEFGMDRRYWIGLTDQLEEGKWQWTHNGSTLEYDEMWYPNQPDHFNKVKPANASKDFDKEHCVALWNPGYYAKDENTHKFNDEPCKNKYYAICEHAKL